MSTVIFKPHDWIGYWGYGVQPELEQRLSQVLNHCGLSQSRRRSSGAADGTAPQDITQWGIAHIGLNQPLPAVPIEPGSTRRERIATLSASGLDLYPQADGSFYPDAWVEVSDSTLILGREPFGRVSLYWLQSQQVVWFASRLQLLLPLQQVEISVAGLYSYACFSYVATPFTPIQAIQAVPAGVQHCWQRGNSFASSDAQLTFSVAQLWQWCEAAEQLDDEATAIDQLQMLLKAAVQRQLVGLPNAPVGVFLSGGLDSSIVAALLVQAGVEVRAYTLDFNSDDSELAYAQQIAAFLKIPLVRIEATPHRVQGAIDATAQALDLPFGDGVTVPLFLLNQAASQDTTLVFNGEHGDQLFAGWTNKPLIAAGVYSSSTEDFAQRYLRTFHRLHGFESEIFAGDVLRQVALLQPQDWLQDALDPAYCRGFLHRLRRASLMLKGAQNIQPRATRLAFAHGLNVRSPFCDLPLAQWTFQLSGNLCLHNSCEKYILKRAVADWLPPEIVWRDKRGMGVPLTAWCLNQLWHPLGNWLHPATLDREGLWQPDLAARVAAGQLGIWGRRMGETLWLLVMWQAWRKAVLGDAIEQFSWQAAGQMLHHPFWLPRWVWNAIRRQTWN
jgi:asparagine synthase (glutamine-hydrolysing)